MKAIHFVRRDRHHLHGQRGRGPLAWIEIIPEPFQRRGAKLGIAVFQFRIQRIPELLDQTAHQVETIAQPGEALLVQQRLGQPARQKQIFGFVGQRVAGQAEDGVVIRQLDLVFPQALRTRVILPARLPNLVEQRSGVQVYAARVISGNGAQKLGADWHGLLRSAARRLNFERTHFQQRDFLAIHQQNFPAQRKLETALVAKPLRNSPQADIRVVACNRPGRERGKQYVAEVLPFERRARAQPARRPEHDLAAAWEPQC